MRLALSFADRIVPISGHNTSTGRFGESYDLASKERHAYAAVRRPRQLAATAALALLTALFLMVNALRKVGASLVMSICIWAAWFWQQTDVRELPPLPLAFLTASCIGFLTAGIVSGALTLLQIRGWRKVVAAPMVAAVCALLACGFTRTVGAFPIGSEGWEAVFEPLASGILAAPTALALSAGLLRWKS